MNIKTKFNIGESVMIEVYEDRSIQCECCHQKIENRVKALKDCIIVGIRIDSTASIKYDATIINEYGVENTYAVLEKDIKKNMKSL